MAGHKEAEKIISEGQGAAAAAGTSKRLPTIS